MILRGSFRLLYPRIIPQPEGLGIQKREIMTKKRSTYEDLQESIVKMKTPDIEVWKNKYPKRKYMIHLDIPECTCICPKTGLPDFVHLKIDYIPSKVCIELKSLKMYIIFFRNIGIFHEHLVNRLLEDLVKSCDPHWMKVEGIVSPRGGIQTTVEAEYKKR